MLMLNKASLLSSQQPIGWVQNEQEMGGSRRQVKVSELLDTTIAEGPQIVTKRGVETAVLVPSSSGGGWNGWPGRTSRSLLLTPEARTEDLAPPRGQHRRRPPLVME